MEKDATEQCLRDIEINRSLRRKVAYISSVGYFQSERYLSANLKFDWSVKKKKLQPLHGHEEYFNRTFTSRDIVD